VTLTPRPTTAVHTATSATEWTVSRVGNITADVNMDEKNYHDPKSAFWDFGRSMGWFNDDGKWPGCALWNGQRIFRCDIIANRPGPGRKPL
jgi:hypothetical protein